MSTTSPRSARATKLSAQIARRTIAAVLLSAAIASLLLAVPGLQGAAPQIAGLNAAWVVAAVALELSSCVALVVIFRLFFDEVPAGPARELVVDALGGLLEPAGAFCGHGVERRRIGFDVEHWRTVE